MLENPKHWDKEGQKFSTYYKKLLDAGSEEYKRTLDIFDGYLGGSSLDSTCVIKVNHKKQGGF